MIENSATIALHTIRYTIKKGRSKGMAKSVRFNFMCPPILKRDIHRLAEKRGVSASELLKDISKLEIAKALENRELEVYTEETEED